MRGSYLPILALCLAGCVSVEDTQKAAADAWIGHSSDEFFLTYGAPFSVYELASGERLMRWSSGVHSFNIPGHSTTTGSVGPYGMVSLHTTTTPGGSIDTECQIDFVVDAAGLIHQMRIAKDTIGDWALSRCREYLKLKVAK